MSGSVRHVIREIYCEVLFELAEESGVIDSVMEDLSSVAQVLQREPDFVTIMNSPTIKPEDKAQAIRNVFSGKVADLTLDFLSVLARRNRVGFLPGISDKYELMVDIYRGRSLVEVTLPKEPDDRQIEKLRTDLSNAIDGHAKLSIEVDPGLIGGIIIKKDDRVIDNTVRRLLRQATRTITDNLKIKICGSVISETNVDQNRPPNNVSYN